MAWSVESQISDIAALASTTTFGNASTAVALNPGETAEVQISCTFTGTATADLYFRVVASNDNSRWDNVPFTGSTIGRVVSTTQTRTIKVSGVKNFRVEYAQSVSDAQPMTITAFVIKDGVNV